jgi:hypothetical protein
MISRVEEVRRSFLESTAEVRAHHRLSVGLPLLADSPAAPDKGVVLHLDAVLDLADSHASRSTVVFEH